MKPDIGEKQTSRAVSVFSVCQGELFSDPSTVNISSIALSVASSSFSIGPESSDNGITATLGNISQYRIATITPTPQNWSTAYADVSESIQVVTEPATEYSLELQTLTDCDNLTSINTTLIMVCTGWNSYDKIPEF